MCTLVLDNKLYLAPLEKDIQRVLDLGTGTGIWAIDFADEHPSASVVGTDISPIQPSVRWNNCFSPRTLPTNSCAIQLISYNLVGTTKPQIWNRRRSTWMDICRKRVRLCPYPMLDGKYWQLATALQTCIRVSLLSSKHWAHMLFSASNVKRI